MGLDDFTPSESEGGGPKSAEILESFKEMLKKSGAGIKRVQKDEKKSKKHDNLLAGILIEIIKDKRYDFLYDGIFECFDNGYSSNFILGVLSLIYLPVSDKIRDFSHKNHVLFDYEITPDIIEFNDNILDIAVKQRINDWIEDILDIMSIDYSSLQLKNILDLYNDGNVDCLYKLTSKIFVFFFREINIEISHKTSLSYVEFILKEIFKKLKTLNQEEV